MSNYPQLSLTTPNTHSPAVTRLQELLGIWGFDVECDGWFGPVTQKAIKGFQLAQGLVVSGIATPHTWQALQVEDEPDLLADQESFRPRLLDRTTLHPLPAKHGSLRTWNDIWGVTFHQCGCLLGDRPGRWDTLRAHIGVTRDGTVIIVNPLERIIYHGNGLNSRTIGIEIDGLHEGLLGVRRTAPGDAGPHPLTDLQVRACDEILFPWLVGKFEANGGVWRNIHAHRQSSPTRRADPGSEIWQRIAMPWIERLHAKGGDWGSAQDGGPDFTMNTSKGRGRPIPRDWCAGYTAKY